MRLAAARMNVDGKEKASLHAPVIHDPLDSVISIAKVFETSRPCRCEAPLV